MRPSARPSQKRTRWKVIVAAIVLMGSLLLFYQWVSSGVAIAEPQRPRSQRRIRPRPKAEDAKSSSFKHESHREPKAKLSCSKCHTITAREAPDEIAVPTKPGIKGYPYHDSCLECHRTTQPQFFRGATPGICRVCHTRSSPRLTKNDLNTLPEQSAELILGDLSIKFDHSSTSHLSDCTKCHVDVTQLDVGKADAPIATCASSSCHSKTGVQPAFQDQMLKMEDNDIVSGKNEHTCNGCHATTIAGKSPPCTHIKLFDPDGSFFTGAEFSKSAKLIAEKCK